MKTVVLTLALLVSGAAFAQSADSSAATASDATMMQPSNANPERDAHNIAVKSDPAMVPAGFNGLSGSATGGPLVDPATGKDINEAATKYPACSKKVTDNCLQTYERGRKRA